MKLEEAVQKSASILEILSPLCERIEVAGSIRRKKPEIRDIDIVLIPLPLVDFVGVLQTKTNAKVEKRGNKIISLRIDGVGVDLNLATKETFTPILLFRTGSWEHNTKLASKALRLGLKFYPTPESSFAILV